MSIIGFLPDLRKSFLAKNTLLAAALYFIFCMVIMESGFERLALAEAVITRESSPDGRSDSLIGNSTRTEPDNELFMGRDPDSGDDVIHAPSKKPAQTVMPEEYRDYLPQIYVPVVPGKGR